MKRFSVRETALLMAPVLLMGALGWWISKRPDASANETRMTFGLEKPTMLETFAGASAAFVVKADGLAGINYYLEQSSPFLGVKTAQGTEVDWQDKGQDVRWRGQLWMNQHHKGDTRRFLVRLSGVPAGEMHFGCFAIARPKLLLHQNLGRRSSCCA